QQELGFRKRGHDDQDLERTGLYENRQGPAKGQIRGGKKGTKGTGTKEENGVSSFYRRKWENGEKKKMVSGRKWKKMVSVHFTVAQQARENELTPFSLGRDNRGTDMRHCCDRLKIGQLVRGSVLSVLFLIIHHNLLLSEKCLAGAKVAPTIIR